MTNPASGNGPRMSRRQLIAALPATGGAAETDPVVPIYREWLEARREWHDLADLPGNGNWEDPRSLAAEARVDAAEERILAMTPTSLEGIGALVALAWCYAGPTRTDPEECGAEVGSIDCRALMAIWKACTGKEWFPEIGADQP